MKEYKFKINGKDYTVCINSVNDGVADLSVNGKAYEVEISQPDGVAATPVSQSAPKSAQPSADVTSSKAQSSPATHSAAGKGEEVKSPLPGVIIGISVNVGDQVKEGQEVAVLEAMKMENSIEASVSGTITAINVQKGDSVPEGAVLLTIE